MVRHSGFMDMTWDAHGGINGMSLHGEDLSSGLDLWMHELASRDGLSGGTMLDDT